MSTRSLIALISFATDFPAPTTSTNIKTTLSPIRCADWYHQHFGASKEPFRLTAWFGPHNPGREPGPPGEKHVDYTAMDIPEGGSAIPYYMEDPFLRQEYAERMKEEGAENRMRPEYYERDYRGLLPKE